MNNPVQEVLQANLRTRLFDLEQLAPALETVFQMEAPKLDQQFAVASDAAKQCRL